MIRTYQRIQRRRAAGEIEGGFTLIELLIVIVVLGILAAIVVFALGGVTGKSNAAACQSDAKTVGVGVSALMAENPAVTSTAQLTNGAVSGVAPNSGASPAVAGTVGGWEWALTSTGTTLNSNGLAISGNPFVQSWPKSTSYSITVSGGINTVDDASLTDPTSAKVKPSFGDVLVTGKGTGTSQTYDATVNPIEACNWAVLGHA